MKQKRVVLPILLTIILLLNIVISHYLPSAGILTIPIVVCIVTALIIFTDNDFSILTKSILSYLSIGLNDIGLKLFAGGRHDSEGTVWIHMMLFIGLIPSFVMLLIGAFRDKRSRIWIKAISILVFLVLIYVHLEMFEKLGIDVE